jgi:hypothetical protein
MTGSISPVSTRDPQVPPPPPVLLVVFNRPDVTKAMIDSLRVVRPRQLFVAADGPRPGHADDPDLCAQTRRVLDEVDWPCELEVLAHHRNLGLQTSMVTAIDWFWSNVDEGVILEDDCLVHPDYFAFASVMLERYRHVPEVMAVTSVNIDEHGDHGPGSYFFASGGHIWGWASWRRAWEGFDATLADWPQVQDSFGPGTPPLHRALGSKFASAHAGAKRTWARAWHFTVARQQGLVVVPSVNMVHNIGLAKGATHTTSGRHRLAHLRARGLPQPLVHPDSLMPDVRYDAALARYHRWGFGRRLRENFRRLKVTLPAAGW